jgi:hypothetical protein
LEDTHPFDDTDGVDIVLREASKMLPPHLEMIGAKTAGRIWGFLSKFVMLDRFSEVLGTAEVLPGLQVPRTMCLPDYLGTSAKKVSYHVPLQYITLLTMAFRSLKRSTHQQKLPENF